MVVVNNTNRVCPDILDDRQAVLDYYQDYLNGGYETALATQADAEFNSRMIEVFGSNDIGAALLTMAVNPGLVSDGAWGFAHGGISVLALQGAADPVEEDLYQRAYYYTREATARCKDSSIVDHLDPLQWSEDSRLDYYSVVKMNQWYLDQI